MGNCSHKTKKYTPKNEREERQAGYTSRSSVDTVDNIASNRSTRFALFGGSGVLNSIASTRIELSQRSRVSRKSFSRNQGLSNEQLSFSKTKWHVPQFEAAFLPEFKIRGPASEAEFDFVEIISKGAYGKVYKVHSRHGGGIFALKVLNKAQIIAENAVERVKDEVRIQQVVGHHPFVVNSSCHWQDRRRLYVGSDYISGGELYTLVEKYGSLPEDAVRILVAEVALAIDFLHNAGIVHRDIKASNILLDDKGHAQLIDFGFAKWLKRGQKTSTLCGTPRYIAPEILQKEPYGHAVDWWSLGVLMFFLLTTEYPFPAKTDLSLTNSVETTAESFSYNLSSQNRTSLSTAANDLIKRLLELDTATRIRSIIGLQRVAFYKNCDFRSYTCRTVSPFQFLSITNDQGSKIFEGRDSGVEDIPMFPGF